MKKILLSLFFLTIFSRMQAHAITFFWDANSTALGSGGDAPVGSWGVDPFWNEDGTGGAANGGCVAWASGASAIFSAGFDATGAYTVNVTSGLQVADIHVDLGVVTFEGGPINLMAANGDNTNRLLSVGHKDPGAIARYNTPLAGASNLIRYKMGTVIFGATNTYTGATIIEGGVLQLGAPQVIPASSKLVLANNDPSRSDFGSEWTLTSAILATDGFNQNFGTLQLTGTRAEVERVIDFGGGTSAVSFANSSAEDWGAFVLTIVNYSTGDDSLRFGTNSSGLTSAQLAQIKFVEFDYMPGKIDAQGFVTPDLPVIHILSATRVGTARTDLTWTSTPGRLYRVQYKDDLDEPAWTDISPDVSAVSSTTTYSDTPATASARFYRVMFVP